VILIAGHYCHDVLIARDGSETRTLGGSASYGSAILDAFGEPYEVAAKVGTDFLYSAQVSKQPQVVASRTTSFVDDYRGGERVERVSDVCEPLQPDDLPRRQFAVGLAFGVAGEVGLPVLAHMRELCGVVLADAQSLVRFIDSGQIHLRPLDPEAVPHLDYLKASHKEAALLDVAALRQRIKLILTDGPRGCTLLSASSELHVPAIPAVEVDPTGAGDCFLTGFAIGLARGYSEERALHLASWCGARAVEFVGVPRITDTRSALA
jgi:1D-myo-inositol 3-kinase